MSDQYTLSKDLESDPFLNSALQRFTCKLYYRFGSFLAPLSIGIITSRHFLSERNVTDILKMEKEQMKETSKKPSTCNASPSKYAGLGAAITAELMIDLWFDVGMVLAVGVVDGLNYFVGAITRGK